MIAAWGLWGFGYTFMSGAYQAWITDEVGVDNVGGVFLRGTRIGFIGSFVGLGLQFVDRDAVAARGRRRRRSADRALRRRLHRRDAGDGLPPPSARRAQPRIARAEDDRGERPALRPLPAAAVADPRRSRSSEGCRPRRSTGSGRRTSSATSACRRSSRSIPSCWFVLVHPADAPAGLLRRRLPDEAVRGCGCAAPRARADRAGDRDDRRPRSPSGWCGGIAAAYFSLLVYRVARDVRRIRWR